MTSALRFRVAAGMGMLVLILMMTMFVFGGVAFPAQIGNVGEIQMSAQTMDTKEFALAGAGKTTPDQGGGPLGTDPGGAERRARPAAGGRSRRRCTAGRRFRPQRRLVSPRQQDRPARRVSTPWHSIPTQERCCCTRPAPWWRGLPW